MSTQVYSKKFPTGGKPIPYAYLTLLAVCVLLSSYKGLFGRDVEEHTPVVSGVWTARADSVLISFRGELGVGVSQSPIIPHSFSQTLLKTGNLVKTHSRGKDSPCFCEERQEAENQRGRPHNMKKIRISLLLGPRV